MIEPKTYELPDTSGSDTPEPSEWWPAHDLAALDGLVGELARDLLAAQRGLRRQVFGCAKQKNARKAQDGASKMTDRANAGKAGG